MHSLRCCGMFSMEIANVFKLRYFNYRYKAFGIWNVGKNTYTRHLCQVRQSQGQGTESNERKAAMLCVGDEILNGAIVDTNTPWLAKFLHAKGIDLVRVEYVPDDIDDIGESVMRCRSKVGDNGFVFTSGGIGPTHDDKTYEAIAKALGLKIELHEETRRRMESHYKERNVELNESRLRMAHLPAPCSVLPPPKGSWVPLVKAGGNVYILPGIPRLFQSMIENHESVFRGVQCYSSDIFLNLGEGDLAEQLATIASENPTVRIGSYPNTDWDMNKGEDQNVAYRVKIQVQGRDEEAVARAVQAINTCFSLDVVPGT